MHSLWYNNSMSYLSSITDRSEAPLAWRWHDYILHYAMRTRMPALNPTRRWSGVPCGLWSRARTPGAGSWRRLPLRLARAPLFLRACCCVITHRHAVSLIDMVCVFLCQTLLLWSSDWWSSDAARVLEIVYNKSWTTDCSFSINTATQQSVSYIRRYRQKLVENRSVFFFAEKLKFKISRSLHGLWPLQKILPIWPRM